MPYLRQRSACVSLTVGSGLIRGGTCGGYPGYNSYGFGLNVILLLTVGIHSHKLTQEILKAKIILWALLSRSADLRDRHLLAFPVR